MKVKIKTLFINQPLLIYEWHDQDKDETQKVLFRWYMVPSRLALCLLHHLLEVAQNLGLFITCGGLA